MIVVIENITARYVTASEPFVGGIPPLTAFHGWIHRMILDACTQHQLNIHLQGFGVAHGQAWYHSDHPRFVNYQKRDKAKAADNASTVDRRRMDLELCLFLDIAIDRSESEERVKQFFATTKTSERANFEKIVQMSTFKKGYIETEARGRRMQIRTADVMRDAVTKVSKLWKVITPYKMENAQNNDIDFDAAIDEAWQSYAIPTIIGGLQIHDYETHVREWPAIAIEHVLGWICTKPLGLALRDDSYFMYQPDARTVIDENGDDQQCFLLIPYTLI